MQPMNFGIRKSSAESADESRSRYVPSSVYSGPGPAEESPALGPSLNFMSGALRGPYEDRHMSRLATVSYGYPRSSTLLNINDPVAMHLLTETAISDSRDYEVLSFEEVEQLKKERGYLRGKIETTKRKLALESKLRDAAQSLNRLYSTRDKPDPAGHSPKRSRRSFLGVKPAASDDAVTKADDEYAASHRKVEALSQELAQLEAQLEQTERRILEHTAGILQLTHKGLKKNIRRTELPRSPESMASQPHNRSSGIDGVEDFDERSLYQVPDYVADFGQNARNLKSRASTRETQAIDNVASRLEDLNTRLHMMITHAGGQGHFEPPPRSTDDELVGRVGAQIQAHLGYLEQGLNAVEAAQSQTAVAQIVQDSEDQLEDVNIRLQDMLERTNSVSHSPALPQDEARGKDLQSQLAFSSVVLDRLNQRVETLVEQKDILARQIQQQRELNSKSDAQRDATIHELTSTVDEFKRMQVVSEEEAQHSRDQMHLLMEQLDLAKQEKVLMEQERGVADSQAIEAERAARKETEEKLLAQLQSKQNEHAQLQSAKAVSEAEVERHRTELAQLGLNLASMKTEREEQAQSLAKKVQDAEAGKTAAEAGLVELRNEIARLESEAVRLQTELNMVKAELDGAHGTRAQRVKDVEDLTARNKELESRLDAFTQQREAQGATNGDLQEKLDSLQKELKETIEEYEAMAKQSIDEEKERERLEEAVDELQHRCEALESQLSEEKVKWLGAKGAAPAETTSTMVLKNEFKKMMRETRVENLKMLKAEQEERRRLDGIIKNLKKDLQQLRSRKEAPATQNGLIEAH